MADSSDKAVRENSLKVFAEAYTLLGEDIWRLLSKDVPVKVKGLLEARFKQVVKKAGNNLAASINSNRVSNNNSSLKAKDPLTLTGNAGKPKGFGAKDGLKFNKPSDKESDSMKHSIKTSEKENSES